jgi:hypothetical protein
LTALAVVRRGAAARRGRRGSIAGVGSAGERAQEELRWRAFARDAGTQWHQPCLRHSDLWWCKSGRIEDARSLAREMHEGRRAGRRGGESKATDIARRARKEQLRSGKAVRTGVTRRGFDAQRKTNGEVTGPGGPSGIELARSRVRAEVFYQ